MGPNRPLERQGVSAARKETQPHGWWGRFGKKDSLVDHGQGLGARAQGIVMKGTGIRQLLLAMAQNS